MDGRWTPALFEAYTGIYIHTGIHTAGIEIHTGIHTAGIGIHTGIHTGGIEIHAGIDIHRYRVWPPARPAF